MKCPYCDHTFPLTWGRYLSSPLGVHRCPQCQKKSRLSHTSSYYTAILTLFIVLLGLGIFIPNGYLGISLLDFYTTGYNWGWIYGAVLVFMILDKLCDSHLRDLEKRDKLEFREMPEQQVDPEPREMPEQQEASMPQNTSEQQDKAEEQVES